MMEGKKCSKIIIYFNPPIDWESSHRIADAIIMIKGVTHLHGVRARKKPLPKSPRPQRKNKQIMGRIKIPPEPRANKVRPNANIIGLTAKEWGITGHCRECGCHYTTWREHAESPLGRERHPFKAPQRKNKQMMEVIISLGMIVAIVVLWILAIKQT